MNKYTKPKISTANPKDWFVWFRFTHNGQRKLIKCRENINRVKDLSERRAEIKALCHARTLWLKNGWNPVVDPLFAQRTVFKQKIDYSDMVFCEAIRFAMDKKRAEKLSSKTIMDYSNMVERILKVSDKTGHSYVRIQEFERSVILELMSACAEKLNLSNHGYNKYNDLVRSLFSVLVDWSVIKYNPAARIKRRKVAESNKYESLTDSEKKAIFRHLSDRSFGFLTFIQIVYYTGLRPKEILRLKIKDIRLSTNVIVLAPDLKAENSKTSNLRHVAINPFLKEILRRQITGYSDDNYLIGSCYPPGGNRGSCNGLSGAMHPDYFKPSPYRIKRDTVTKLWHKMVIEDLGIDKHLYALKHTGADDLILAGVSVDALKEMFGHTSKVTTEIYISKVKALRRAEIISNARAFSEN